MKQILTVMVLISLMPILTGCAGNWKGAVMDSVKPKLQSKIINTTHWKTCQLSQKKLAFKYPDTFDECQEGYPAFTLISKTGQSCKITCLNKIRVREQNILKGQFIKNCDGQYLTQNDKVDARHNSDKDICFTHFDELLERQNTFIVGNYIKTSYGGFFKYPKSNFWVIDFMGINYGFEPEDQSRQSAIFSDYKCPSTCYSGMAQISDKLVIAMLKTLKNMKSQPNYVYAQNPIYYHEIPKNADPETFTILNYAIAKDKDHIYYYGQPVEYVDLKTFKIIPIQNGEIGIIKDKNNVYKGGSDQRGGNTLKIIDGVDPGTIKVISAEYRGFTRDKNNFYCDWHALKDVDAATFKVLDSYAARDKDNMFLCWEGKYKINPMGLEKSKDDDWLILRNKQAGYEIKFPPNWQYIDDSYGKVNSISFGEIDKTYNIEASLMHGGISVDVPEDKRDFSFDKLLKEVKEAQKGTEIIYSADRTKINGLDAVLVKAMFGTEVHFERGGKRYTVSVYPFSTNGKDNQYDVFEKMLKTFKFIDETADAVKNTDETSNSESINKLDWLTYKNEINKYELKYPSNWKVIESRNQVTFESEGEPPSVRYENKPILFLTIKILESTKELPEPLPKSNFSLEEWFATKIECFEKENFSKLIDGMPVKRGYYSCTGDGPYSNVNYFLVEKDGKIYEFSTNVSEGQMMLASFKFLQ